MQLLSQDDSEAELLPSFKGACGEYGPFGELLRATGPMAKLNPFRFSTKYQDDETDLVYYGRRYYNASTGRMISRDPLNDKAFLNEFLRGTSIRKMKQLKSESLMPVYGFVRNNPISRIDVDGRLGVGSVLIGGAVCCAVAAIDAGACWLHMRDIRLGAHADANTQMAALDPNYDPEVNGPDNSGSNADALRHCIGSCRANQNPGPCLCSAFVRYEIQDRETTRDLAHDMDRANNAVGFGIKGDCVTGCVTALRTGQLLGFGQDDTVLRATHVP